MSQTNQEFIRLHNPTHYPTFSELPEDARKAIRVYCQEGFVNDEEFAAHVATYSFLLTEIPTSDVTTAVMNREGSELSGDFYEWNGHPSTWVNAVDHGDSRWPCILSGFDDELFQDGWHRFYGYVKNEHPTIKVLAFMPVDFTL